MRHAFLFFFILALSGRVYASEPWAFCDGSNRAYKVVSRVKLDCSRPRQPGEPARVPTGPVDPDLCKESTVQVAVNTPDLDYICAYPTAYETGDAAARNTNRCINADAKFCQIGAGGVEGPGEHTIPSNGWYHIRGTTGAFPDLRCQCGCFVGETLIAGASGYNRIDALAEQAKAMPVGVAQFSQSRGVTYSQPLRGSDFTVGPEDKPVIRIATASGSALVVTDIHPIFVQRNASLAMIQARDVRPEDALLDENGNPESVQSVESYRLDITANKVYNLDTKSTDPEEHVISANRLLVGDLYWQKRLSEESSRVENLLASAQN